MAKGQMRSTREKKKPKADKNKKKKGGPAASPLVTAFDKGSAVPYGKKG
jgi:hypothetical protein